MAKKLYDEYDISEIASAIRKKNGKEDKYKVSEMAQAIGEISTGIEPSGTKSVTSNGIYNVKEYENVDVNVKGGVDISDYFMSNTSTNGSISIYARSITKALLMPNSTYTGVKFQSYLYNCINLTDISEFSKIDTSLVASFNSVFYTCRMLKNLEPVRNWNTNKIINMGNTFYGLGTYNNTEYYDFSPINNWNTSKVSDFQFCFSNINSSTSSWIEKLPDTIEINWCLDSATNVTSMFRSNSEIAHPLLKGTFKGLYTTANASTANLNMSNMFIQQHKVKIIDLSKIIRKVSNIAYMFGGCKSAELIDIRGLTCSSITSASYISGTLNNVPTTVKIIVKDETEKAWWQGKFSSYSSCFYTPEEAISSGIVSE